MSTKLQIIILVALIFLFIFMIVHINKRKLEFKFCLPWLLFLLVCIILTCFPKLLYWFSNLVGIATPINVLFLAGFCLSLCIIYVLTMAISKLTSNMTTLTQRIALLEKEIEDLKDEHRPD